MVAPTTEDLRARYFDYRRRQTRALLGMLPHDAVRPLYRRALSLAGPSHARRGEVDPLGRLLEFCETLLPLPPFDVWLDDLRRSPEAHLLDLDASAEAPTAAAPATLAARGFARGDDPWLARLRAFRDPDAWRGFIAFEERATGTVHRTSLIFRESGPTDLRERFLGFEHATLEAFLRSALP